MYVNGALRPTRLANKLVKLDLAGGGRGGEYAGGAGTVPSEAIFVPRPGGEVEDDGCCSP